MIPDEEEDEVLRERVSEAFNAIALAKDSVVEHIGGNFSKKAAMLDVCAALQNLLGAIANLQYASIGLESHDGHLYKASHLLDEDTVAAIKSLLDKLSRAWRTNQTQKPACAHCTGRQEGRCEK